ncbi:MAG: 6-phosphofructokinase [Candidatus Omnitrophica bacterium]|nr:6-phosphofructokinase [Candidatus Omnitrophota bacterium]
MEKGNLLVGQAGGCTAVINQSLVGIIETAKKSHAVEHVIGMRNGILGVLRETFFSLDTFDKKTLMLLKNTPSSALGSCRYKLKNKDYKAVLASLKKQNVHYLLLIGGNDTAQTCLQIAYYAREKGYPLSVVAVPKTIDNDLPCMDHTPGYGSAATFVACATQEAGKDTEAMKDVDPVKIIEVMGRNSGWLVAAAALGKRCEEDAPHLLYFPERPFDENRFLDDVKKVYDRIGYVVVVVSETIRDAQKSRIGAKKSGIIADLFGHQYVEGTAVKLCQLVEKKLKLRARFDKPGTIQRMSMNYISPTDRREAYMVGEEAVRLAVKGTSGIMVTLERILQKPYRCRVGSVKIEKIAGVEKYLPNYFINRKGNFVTKAFYDYALPLVGELPTFIRL